jgi:hypothetical protein
MVTDAESGIMYYQLLDHFFTYMQVDNLAEHNRFISATVSVSVYLALPYNQFKAYSHDIISQ